MTYLLPECARNRRVVPAETLFANRVRVLVHSTSHLGRGGRERISDEQRRELLVGILLPDMSVAMMIKTHKTSTGITTS